MQNSIKVIATVLWVALIGIAGLAGKLQSPSAWVLSAVAAFLPPTVMLWRWNTPPQTLSESINEARR